MPIPPSTLKYIRAVRKLISSGGVAKSADRELYTLIQRLFQNSAKIVNDAETLDAVLALAADFETYRGKGAQYGTRAFYDRLSGLFYHAPVDAAGAVKHGVEYPSEAPSPPRSVTAIPWFEKLGDYFFQRVHGPRVRSQHAGDLRRMAWGALGDLSEFAKHPELLAHAQKVAADSRAAEAEREGAVMFMSEYWAGEDPDHATAELLWKLEENPPSRSFLVTVLQAQIDLGLNDEFGGLFAVGEWDDAEEE